jgi:DNA-binding CsgD family transcriptional regulator
MTAPVRVSERDLHSLLGIISDHRDDLPPHGLPWSLLHDLMGQIRCDRIALSGIDTIRQENWLCQETPADPDDEVTAPTYWKHYKDCEACSYRDRSGDLRSVTKVSDFYSVRQWHSTGMYTDYYRPYGIEHLLGLVLPAGPGPAPGPGQTLRLGFVRGPGPEFSERDRALLALLRPHLHQAYLDAEQRRHPVPQLTPRQKDLLRLVAAGHTNAQIAWRLGISEGTVRIHLQNIYARLHVSSRTAAVTKAFPDRP